MLSGGATGAEQATPVRRRCCYDEAVREALVLLWGPGSDLRQAIEPLIPILVGSMECHGHLRLTRQFASAC
jgi:hypothetical protein